MKTCRRCQERGKPAHFGSDPKCAWPDGVFCKENWQCATMNVLRSLIYEALDTKMWDRFCTRCDDESIGVLWVQGGFYYIVLSYYKDRGCTSGAYCILNGSMSVLTLAEAEEAIEILSKIKELS